MKEGEEPIYIFIKERNNNNKPTKAPKRGSKGGSSTASPSSPSSPSSPLTPNQCYYCTWNEVCTQDEFKAHLEKCAEIERDRLS